VSQFAHCSSCCTIVTIANLGIQCMDFLLCQTCYDSRPSLAERVNAGCTCNRAGLCERCREAARLSREGAIDK
jgi:hypothetical protein